jgi:HTH-type transcriptional regulator, sugar sensing transcriptional regulator
MISIEESLKEIGLTNYETKIYLALLELGEAKSGQILAKAGIYSGNVYEILESLKNKGLVSETIKNNVKHYSPANPERILDYLDEKEKRIEEQKENIQDLIPKILSKINQYKKSPIIEVYTGLEGLKTAMLKETKKYKKGVEVAVLGIKEDQKYSKKIIDYFIYNIYPLRKKLSIKVRKINDISYKKIKTKEKAEIKYLPHPSTTTINICEDLTILVVYSETLITITIESKDVAESFLNQFNLLWKQAKD